MPRFVPHSPVYQMLEERMPVHLVNAAHVSKVWGVRLT